MTPSPPNRPKRRPFFRRSGLGTPRRRASSLITTLLVLVVLSTIVVAFMQSMSIERSVARSVKNTFSAELAAYSGLERVLSTIQAVTNFHYVVGNETTFGTNYGPVLLVKQMGQTNVVSTNKLFSFDPGNSNAIIRPNPNVRLEVSFMNLTNERGEITARFAYWAEDNSRKQHLALYQGLSRTNNGLTNISQLPLVETNLSLWATNAYSAEYAAIRNAGLTVSTANQAAAAQNLSHPIEDFNYTFQSTSALLRPDGYPRLQLQKLKDYLDGHNTGTPLPLLQGPSSPRVQLVRQLLNETGTNSPDISNPWGYGSLDFLTNSYSVSDARQIVANLIDYIDEDLIPTTDGSAGTQPPGLDISASSKTSNNPNSVFAQQTPPTFLGQEARAESNGASISIKGHPFIAYVGSGFIINSGANPINSTRIMGWMQFVNPYDTAVQWKFGSSDGYFVDMQVGLGGQVSGGSRGTTPQASGTQGYFLTHALAQISGYSSAPGESHIGRSLNARSKVMFPREWHSSGFDLANGWYTINSPAITISNFTQTIQVCRLVYRLNNQRYIVQDLGALQALPRSYVPSTTSFGGAANIKHPYGQLDWHLIGDPRLNFRTNDWSLASSTGPANGPINSSGGSTVYSTPVNPDKDERQNMPDSSTWYVSTNVGNHFPRFTQGYRPSLPSGQRAMLAYNEFGFLSAGRPWQTLRLYSSTNSTNVNSPDWRISDFVDIGALSSTTNSMTNTIVDGQINVNTRKAPSMVSLLANIPSLTNSTNLAADLIAAATNSLLHPTDIFNLKSSGGTVILTNNAVTDFGKEVLYGQVAPALTSHGNRFTIYSLGQAMQNGVPKSTFLLEAEVELRPVLVNGSFQLRPQVISARKIN